MPDGDTIFHRVLPLSFLFWLSALFNFLIQIAQGIPQAAQRIDQAFLHGLFAIEDLRQCGAYLKTCFGGGALWNAGNFFDLRSYAVTLVILVIASTQLGKRVWSRLPERVDRILTPILMLGCLLVCTAYLVDGSYNPFLYFRF